MSDVTDSLHSFASDGVSDSMIDDFHDSVDVSHASDDEDVESAPPFSPNQPETPGPNSEPPPDSAIRLAANRAVYGTQATEAEVRSLCPAHLQVRRNFGAVPRWATDGPHSSLTSRYLDLVGGPSLIDEILSGKLPLPPPTPPDVLDGRTAGCPGCALVSPIIYDGLQWQHRSVPPSPSTPLQSDPSTLNAPTDSSSLLLPTHPLSMPEVTPPEPLDDSLAFGGTPEPFIIGDVMRDDDSSAMPASLRGSGNCAAHTPTTSHRRTRRGHRGNRGPHAATPQSRATSPPLAAQAGH